MATSIISTIASKCVKMFLNLYIVQQEATW